MAASASPVSVEQMEALVGHQFPGGTFTIHHWENVLLCDAMACDPLPDGLAHPSYLFHAPLAGLGVSYGDIFELCYAESEEAIRAGEFVWDVREPLRVGHTYRMAGEILSVVRKRGRRAGLMDIVTFRIDAHESTDDSLVTSTTYSWVFLRSE